jgi:hypothetical protein
MKYFNWKRNKNSTEVRNEKHETSKNEEQANKAGQARNIT